MRRSPYSRAAVSRSRPRSSSATDRFPTPPTRASRWLAIYRDVERYWDLYELAEKLIDVEYRLQKCRFAHLKTIERVIGFRPGTGGTRGAAYLAKRMERSFFLELFSLRTAM
jgi:tryptophan 2,3-dioxygenase